MVGREQTFTYCQDRILVGRSEACDLCLTEEMAVSQEHLLIFRYEENWHVVDLGSDRGTTLNGVKLEAHNPIFLRDKDCMVLADAVKIRFCLAGDGGFLPSFGRGYEGIVLLVDSASCGKRLSEAEERELGRLAAQGDRDARDKLLEANYPLVEDIVRQYSNQNWSQADLLQEGTLALLQAIEKFDWTGGSSFATYAAHCIRYRVRALAAEWKAMEKLAGEPMEPAEYEHVICSREPEVSASGTELAEMVAEMLDALTEQEADVLRMRFGLLDGRTHSPEEVGRAFDISPMRIRQIENKAIRKLRHPRRVKNAPDTEQPDSGRRRGWFDDTDRRRDKGRGRSWFTRSAENRPLPRTDDIQFRAAAPAELKRGQYFLVKLMAYLESDFPRADREQKSLGDRVAADSSGVFEAALQQTFQIRLFSQDFPMEEKLVNLTWNGKYASTQTDILLPADYTGEQVRLVARVCSDIRVLTDLILILQVQAAKPQEVVMEKRPIKTAFASYASLDRDKVLARIQGLLLGREDLDVFLDKKDMVPGEYWEKRLYREIEKRDVFYLFWSNNARNSEWVRKELAYAIEKKGSWFIHPVALEDPRICPPPEQLRDRHFGDWTLHYRTR